MATLLERISNFFKKKNKKISIVTIDNNVDVDRVTLTPETIYLTLPVFRSVIDYIAKTCSQVPIYIYKDGKQVSTDFLINPNKKQTWTQFIFESVAKKLIYGENILSYNKGELFNLDNSNYTSISNLGSNKIARITPNPINASEPLSLLETCKILAYRHKNNLEATANLIENGGMGGILSLNLQNDFATTKILEHAENELKKKFSGGKNYGKIAILGMPFTYSKVSSNAQELGIIDFYKFDLLDVCRVFSVPSVLLNDNEQSTYNNILEAEKRLYRTVIIPEIQDLCDAITKIVKEGLRLRGLGDAYIWFNINNIYALQEDISSVIDNELKLLNAGVITVEEVRSKLER